MKAFIYDMDGVIVDSEPGHLSTMTRMLEKMGVEGITPKAFEPYQGSSDINMWQDFVQKYHLPEAPEKYVKAKKYLFDRTMHEEGAKPIPGVLDLIARTNALRTKGIKTAVASSSDPGFIHFVMTSLGILSKFDVFQSGAVLPQSKPDPAIYLKTAADLVVDPRDCVVIEDTENGARAAKAAGMYCIGFVSPHSGKQDLSMADEIIDDMADIDLGKFFG